jgi:dipeptidyl aminopeptidase/acylaminoacyl peptidase
MRIALIVAMIGFLSSCNCPRKEKKIPKVDKKIKKTVTKSVSAIDTKAPSSIIRKNSFKYDPNKDPGNKNGFNLIKNRNPEDPTDAKKKTFTIETLYKLKSISSLKWSPDGKRLLFLVVSTDLHKGTSKYVVNIMNSDGSGVRELTDIEKASYHPVWSPDSNSFLFISSRSGSQQVWVMDLKGGDPRQITKISTGVSDPIYSPDGKNIIFSSLVFPEYGADDDKNKKLMEDIKNSPIKAHVADALLFRHWNFYKDGRRSHILSINIKSKKVVDLTPGDYESPAFSLGGTGFAVSPDSKEICFVSNRQSPDAQAWTTNKDLFVVPLLSSGEVKPLNLTIKNRAFDGEPSYSPDGKYIAFTTQRIPGYESDRVRIAVYHRSSGEIKTLTEGFDNWVYAYQWASDSKSILFKAPVKGRYPLFRLHVESGKIQRIKKIPTMSQFNLSSLGKIAFTSGRVGRPTELFIMDAKGSIKKVTDLNGEIVKEYDVRPAEEVWITGANGKKVHTFIVKPHGYKKGVKYPLIINVHGGPQFQWADYLRGDWQVYAGAGYVVAFPNPHGSTGYGQQYTAAISKDWTGKVYKDIMMVTDYLSKLDYVDKDRMGAMGWSWGGYLMNWILGHNTKFKALVSMMSLYDIPSMYGTTEELWFPEWDVGGTPWDNPEKFRKQSPSSYVKNFKTPTLVITGEKDYRLSYTQSLQLFTALRKMGVESKMIIFPNDGHWPNYVKSMPLYYAAHLDWFHKYLKGGKSPWKLEKMIRGRAFSQKKQ